MKRDNITALLPEIGKETLDQIMNLHGADLTALRGQLNQAQRDLTEARGRQVISDPSKDFRTLRYTSLSARAPLPSHGFPLPGCKSAIPAKLRCPLR